MQYNTILINKTCSSVGLEITALSTVNEQL